MSRTLQRRAGRSGLTLERAILVAMLLHGVAGLVFDFWPGLLRVQASPAESDPLRFQFVDTPDTPPPEQPPETEALSDIDREAGDRSPRDDRPTAQSEGNTLQPVLRSTPSSPAPQPRVQPSPDRRPETESESTEEPLEEPNEQPAETRAEEASEPTEQPSAEPSPAVPPRNTLQSSLAQLESFVEPMVLDNPDGGADSQSLAQFDTRGYDLGAYLREALRRIEANWRSNIPPLIRTGAQGATFVGLAIRRERAADGSERAVIVIEQDWTSGQPAYDAAAAFALQLSSPLPPIPEYYPYDSITGRLGFIYNMDRNEVVFPGQR